MIQTEAFFNGSLVKDAAFRAADSFFSRVDKMDELPLLLANIERLTAEGKLEA